MKNETISRLWNDFHNIADVQLLSDWPEAKHRYTAFDAVALT